MIGNKPWFWACMVLLLSFRADAQFLKSYVPPSPTAAGLGLYGDINVGYYTGVPDISIPFYTAETSAFKLPLTLNYHSGGLKIMEEASGVGLGWSLSSGGVVTRALRSLDDMSSNGYYKVPPSQRTFGSGKDIEPDIFYYNFLGVTGKFLLDYTNGTGYVVRILKRDDDLRIELNSSQEWEITTPDGTKYTFAKKEYVTQSTTTTYGPQPSSVTYISSWFLSSITQLNGQVITFNYTSAGKTVRVFKEWVKKDLHNFWMTASGECYNSAYNSAVNPPDRTVISYTTATTDDVLLSSISFQNGSLTFSYSNRSDLNGETSGPVPQKLDDIRLYDSGNNELKRWHFTFDYFSSGSAAANHISKRLKLLKFEEIAGATSRIYRFGYYSGGSFPDKEELNAGEPYGFYSANPMAGILTQIEYPTGGRTTFEYEPHDYSETPTVYQPAGSKLGLRIKKITRLERNSTVLGYQQFEYKKLNSSNQPVSSGKLISAWVGSYDSEPSTSTVWCGSDAYSVSVVYTITRSSNVVQVGEAANGATVGYDQVTVYNGVASQTGKTVHYFRNNKVVYGTIFPGIPGTYDNATGLPLKTEVYEYSNFAFNLVQQQNFSYDIASQATVTGYKAGSIAMYGYTINPVTVKVTQRQTKTFQGSKTQVETTDLSYGSSYFNPSRIDETSSRGEVYSTIKRYPYDMVALGTTTPYSAMVAANMLSQVIEEEKQVNSVKRMKTINEYATGWSANSSLILPSETKTQYKNNAVEPRLQVFDYDSFGNALSLAKSPGPRISYSWGADKRYPVAECKNCSANEFFIEDFEGSGPLSGNSTTAHTGTYAHNGSVNLASYFSSSQSGRTYLLTYFSYDGSVWKYQESAYTGQTISGLLDDIRIYPTDGQISTFTYKSLFGVTSSVDTKGLTTYYEYTPFMELQTVRDGNRAIVKSYEYYIAPYTYFNTVASTTLAKNDCSVGVGTQVTYTVPAGQYSSLISQQDADAQAQADITANAQNYANTQGTCMTNATYTLNYATDPYFSTLYVNIEKLFEDNVRAKCKIRIRYDSFTNPYVEFYDEIQFEIGGSLNLSTYYTINAVTWVEADIIEIIPN